MSRKKPHLIPPPYPQELEGKSDGEDWISRLPNEIIIHILSLLTVRDAISTSALSRRWRYMWTFTSSLDFDAQKKMREEEELHHIAVGGKKYIKWVNQVLDAHKADTIDCFRACYELFNQNMSDVDRWFHFAIQKRVKRFELDFTMCMGQHHYLGERYSMHAPSHPVGFPGYDSLKDLKLSSVDVSGEFLEYFLSICPMLERLSVVASNTLKELIVPAPSLHLKYLVIRDCMHMEKIEIHAKNIISLTYYGPNITLPLQNIPQLTELFVGGRYCEFLIDNLPLFSSKLSQLEALGLDMHRIEKTTDFLDIPVLSHLKYLEVKLDVRVEESLLGLTSLIKTSPLLQKFTLWLYCRPEGDRGLQKVEKCCHNNLKVVEFFGFVGRAIDLELATYFIENGKALEKIFIDRRDPLLIGRARQFKENRIKISARKHAKLLRKKVPPGGPAIIIN